MIEKAPTLITPATNRRLHQLLHQTGFIARKADLVAGFTDQRTEHSSQMQEAEALKLCTWLQAKVREYSVKKPDDSANKMRRKILALCHTMGWYGRAADGTLYIHAGKPVLDFPRIDKFCIEKGPYKKALQAHTAQELTILVSIFEKMVKSDLNHE